MKQPIFLLVALFTPGLWSQTLPEAADMSPVAESTPQAPPQTRARPVTWKQLVPNIAKDQKHIWTFPLRIGQGNNWAPALAVSAVTVGLVAADPYTAPYFRRWKRI